MFRISEYNVERARVTDYRGEPELDCVGETVACAAAVLDCPDKPRGSSSCALTRHRETSVQREI